MSIHNIISVSRYEVKLLRRSWLFRIFAALALSVITFLHVGTQSNINDYQWNMVALSSSIPFVNIYIFNIAQSIIAIFLAGDFMKRDKKLDTAEVTYVRPMSNTDYIAGKTWGVVRVFVSLNLVALAIAAFINVFASESPVNAWAYLFYLVTLSIPSLLFVLGLSYVVMNLVKNQAITLVLLLGYVVVTLVYLGERVYGAFDFFAVTLPNVFSDVSGHPDLAHYLTQRASFLLAGVGMLTFTVVLMRRLPQHPRKQVVLGLLGGLLLVAGILGEAAYIADYRQGDAARASYLDVYRKYASSDGAILTDARVQLEQEERRITARALLTLENQGDQELSSILLYLNPTLEVTRLAGEEGTIPFHREGQLVIVERTLRPRERLDVQLDYSGEVSERVCYLDVPDLEFYNTKTGNSVLRYGKHYAFVGDNFTLLTPESIWYPVTAPPINPVSLYNIRKDFTRFTLQVVNPRQPVVLSQGVMRQQGDTLVFENEQPLPSISLVMGDYERKAMMLDSLEIALYYFKGHDYFSEDFTHVADTLASVLRWARDDYEVRKNRDYPFKRLTLMETPVSFATYARNWKGASEYVQPEIVFLPELGTTLPNGSFKLAKKRSRDWERRGNRNIEEIDLEMRVVGEFVRNVLLAENTFTGEGNLFVPDLLNNAPGWSSKLNKYDISPLFFNHVTFIRSVEFPIMDVLLNVMLKQETTTGGGPGWRMFAGMNDAQRASEYLNNKSFEQAIMDDALLPEIFYEMLKLKANYLKSYVLMRQASQEFTQFMKEFILQRQFSAVSFTDLNNEFTKSFDINLMDLIPEWYTVNRTPLFIVRGVNSEETTIDDYTRYIVSFHVHNPTPVEGIITARVEGGRGGGGGGGGGFFGGGMMGFFQQEQQPAQFLIPANSYKKVRVLSDNRPNNLSIATNIAQNLPSEMGLRLPRMRSFTTDTVVGLSNGDSTLFMYDPKEITVDNEDKGFRLIQSNQKNTLQSLLKITTEDRYKNINPWLPPSRWTATVGNSFHGDYIKSAYYKRAGSGMNMAEWHADISLPGFYEIYIYNPMIEFRGNRNDEETHQYYKITHADGEDEVSVQTNEDRQTWISVGSFYFSEGAAKITLVDKGFNARQLIFADAVRWVYKK